MCGVRRVGGRGVTGERCGSGTDNAACDTQPTVQDRRQNARYGKHVPGRCRSSPPVRPAKGDHVCSGRQERIPKRGSEQQNRGEVAQTGRAAVEDRDGGESKRTRR